MTANPSASLPLPSRHSANVWLMLVWWMLVRWLNMQSGFHVEAQARITSSSSSSLK